jgi:hypothetical protein
MQYFSIMLLEKEKTTQQKLKKIKPFLPKQQYSVISSDVCVKNSDAILATISLCAANGWRLSLSIALSHLSG